MRPNDQALLELIEHRHWEAELMGPEPYSKAEWMFDGAVWNSAVATLIEIQRGIGGKLHVLHMMSDRTAFFEFRGVPTAIDLFKVVETGITPVIDGGLGGRDGARSVRGSSVPRSSVSRRPPRRTDCDTAPDPTMVDTFTADRTTLFFDPDQEPIAHLTNGQRVVAHTADSLCGLWRQVPAGGMHIDQVIERLGGACPSPARSRSRMPNRA